MQILTNVTLLVVASQTPSAQTSWAPIPVPAMLVTVAMLVYCAMTSTNAMRAQTYAGSTRNVTIPLEAMSVIATRDSLLTELYAQVRYALFSTQNLGG